MRRAARLAFRVSMTLEAAMSNDWTQGGVREVLVNPYHCLSKPAHNVRPNAKLITQMSSPGYLRLLLTARAF